MNERKFRNLRKAILGITSIFLGFLLAMQAKAFANVNSILQRDNSSNVFQEIRLLKNKNADLTKETLELESTIEDLKDQKFSLKAIDDQIQKYRKLTGESKIFGPGITLKVDGKISTPWIVDLVNELFAAGAEAVDINGIRLINESIGFDTLPQGQTLLNGSILNPPYIINAIGDSYLLEKTPNLPGAILDRIEDAFKGIKIEISRKNLIQMN